MKWTGLVIGLLLWFDIIGTPIAIVALTRVNDFSHNANRAVIHARYDDCIAAEAIRRRGRVRVRLEEHELPTNLKLLHVELTPTIQKATEKKFANARAELAPVNCLIYSKEAQP